MRDPVADEHGQTRAETHAAIKTTGLGPAWTYLRLALRALLLPLLLPLHERVRPYVPRLPAVGAAMRAYLLVMALLYGYAAAAFLVPERWLAIGRVGIRSVDAPLAHTLWGMTALVVCLSQLAPMLSHRPMLWTLCAVAPAAWASGWEVIMVWLSLRIGNIGASVEFFVIVAIHFIFLAIRHHFVPALAPAPAPAAQLEQQHLTTAEESDLFDRLTAFLHDPGPSSTSAPAHSHAARRSAHAAATHA